MQNDKSKLSLQTIEVLTKIKEEINKEYGFEGNIPRINYGPCGVFASIFFWEWNNRFEDKVHICFVMTKDLEECDHVCIRLPNGEMYDGGIGIHSREIYDSQFIVKDMLQYDETQLEKWSYGLDRTYPRYCPTFDRKVVQKIVSTNLDGLKNNC
jgi:hypothetical protein